MIPIGKTTDLLLAKSINQQLMINASEVNDRVMKMITKAGMQVGTELTPMAIELMAEDLIDCYKYDSLEDIAEALKKGRQGRYGKVYGKLNGIVLSEWMGKHLEEKAIARENLLSKQKDKEVKGDMHEHYIELMERSKKPRTVMDVLKDANSVIDKFTKR